LFTVKTIDISERSCLKYCIFLGSYSKLAVLRSMTFVSPLKHYTELGIGLLIRGSGFDILLPRMLRLLALGAVLLVVGCVLYIRRIIPGK
jgi:hypothetical protein